MGQYQKKPVIIEAHQFTGSSTSAHRIRRWMETGEPPYTGGVHTRDLVTFEIATLEGDMEATPGDWIIKGIQGEFYPCKPDIFEASYEAVKDGE